MRAARAVRCGAVGGVPAPLAGRPVLKVVGLRKSYGGERVLRGISLEVAEGSVLCVIGPSGSGKSTLLRCLNHLTAPDAGFVYLDGELIGYGVRGTVARPLPEKALSRQRAKIGMVFQQFNLFQHLTAIENVMFGPARVLGVPKRQAQARAREVLGQVGLAARAGAYPRELSGGQQQRVAIARALAMRPRLLLCDEPTSALDPELVGEVLAVLKGLAAGGTTMIVVTHEVEFAREVASEVAFVDEGVIRVVGAPSDVLRQSSDERVRTFLRQVGGAGSAGERARR